uniref:Cyclic nucleotide-binding domain-containing protein n=1 Tax=Globisporangium ultimum (strain ATCC 200006 / CBS 805.95 / DAOM BR144) TaxID=431595 RepID=K3W689_GLOUD
MLRREGAARSTREADADALAASLSLPALKCLTPLEGSLTKEAELSARNVAHRREQAFEDVVQKTSCVLKKALSSSTNLSSPLSAIVQDASLSLSSPGGVLMKSNHRRVSTRFQRAYALHRLHQYERAVADYNACARQEPTHAPVFYNRGCALYALGRKEDAVLDFTKAIKLETNNLLYIESRAIVLKEIGRFPEAIHDYAWLETLRRGATSTSYSDSSSSRATQHVQRSHGSFSSSSSSISDMSVPSVRSIALNAVAGDKESRARDWFLRFLKQKALSRTPSDVDAAVTYAKTWSFFRGMTKEMVEQCLEEATYGHFKANQRIVEQGIRSSSFHVILNTVASLVKNVDVHGVSKVRELKTLCQGDTVGTEPYGVSFADGTLRTLQHIVKTLPQQQQLRNAASPLPSSLPTSSRIVQTQKVHPSLLSSASSPSSSFSDASLSTPVSAIAEDRMLAESDDKQLFAVEPATFTCLDEVHCLALSTEVYRSILHHHEACDLDERIQFLRGCRVFQSYTDDVMISLAAVSSRKLYDPGKDILRTGDIVTQLCVIKCGVCQVRKTITTTTTNSAMKRRSAAKKMQSLATADDLLTSRSNDGSWVLDNGWMLTNPRLVTNAQTGANREKTVTQDVDVAILASGQMFGELSVLQPGQPSQVTIRTQTLVEILVFQEADLAKLNVQFQSRTMNALQDSLLFHNPPQQKIIQLHRELDAWEKEKRAVLQELFRNSNCSNNRSPLCSYKSKTAFRVSTASPSRNVRDSKDKSFKLSPLKKTTAAGSKDGNDEAAHAT